MKRKRFSVEQIVAVLKQAELGLPVVDLSGKQGFLDAPRYLIIKIAFCDFRKRFCGGDFFES